MKEESGGELFTVPQWDLTMRSLSVQKKKMLAHATLPAGVRELTGNAFAILEGISTMPTAASEIDEFWSAHLDPPKITAATPALPAQPAGASALDTLISLPFSAPRTSPRITIGMGRPARWRRRRRPRRRIAFTPCFRFNRIAAPSSPLGSPFSRRRPILINLMQRNRRYGK